MSEQKLQPLMTFPTKEDAVKMAQQKAAYLEPHVLTAFVQVGEEWAIRYVSAKTK